MASHLDHHILCRRSQGDKPFSEFWDDILNSMSESYFIGSMVVYKPTLPKWHAV